MLLYREGHRDKSVVQRPSTDTGPNKRILSVVHRRRTARRTGETRDPARGSATGRKLGPDSCTVVAPAERVLGTPPFESRLAKSPYNPMHQMDLSVGPKQLAGHQCRKPVIALH